MKKIKHPADIINSATLKPGSVVYTAGNAATPQALLKQIVADTTIADIQMLSVLLLGDIKELFSEETCQRISHRIIFNGPHSRVAVNQGWAMYQLIHLSDIPRQLRESLKPNVALISVAGPDNGGNYSLGTTVEAVMGAIDAVKQNKGIIIAERNAHMPFVLGANLHETAIDYLLDVDYDLPLSPVKQPDEQARKIGQIIAQLFIHNGATLQYGIGEVPEAVTDAIIEKGVKDLGIHTELFSDAMRRLVENGLVTNRFTASRDNFSLASLFLSGDRNGYDWYHFNSSVQSRPCDFTNNVLNIARQPNMVAINSAIGIDLHSNIWADSLFARQIYSGVGGQADFLRGAYLSPGGIPIIAMKSTTNSGLSKIVEKCPEGITTTAIPPDPVILVTEHGAFDPRGLSFVEHAVGIAHIAAPEHRDELLRRIYENKQYFKPQEALRDGRPPKGFIPFDAI